jgi:transposase-like protein
MEQMMTEFFKRPIEGRYPVIILDGLGLGETTAVAAMGIDADGHKKILGLTVGGTENNEVVKGLLADMIGRGLDPGEGRLYVIDGGKALHKAITDTFGATAVVQRCQVHKKRNVLAHLPKSEQDNVSLALSMAYLEAGFDLARKELMDIAAGLSSRYPKAATSLLEGLEETLTVHRLKVPGLLRKTLCNTNVLESANSSCRGVLRRVSNFKDGEMALRYAAAGFLQAERGFRRITGYKELGFLEARLSLYDIRPRSIQTA